MAGFRWRRVFQLPLVFVGMNLFRGALKGRWEDTVDGMAAGFFFFLVLLVLEFGRMKRASRSGPSL